jgi:hypothetical protein
MEPYADGGLASAAPGVPGAVVAGQHGEPLLGVPRPLLGVSLRRLLVQPRHSYSVSAVSAYQLQVLIAGSDLVGIYRHTRMIKVVAKSTSSNDPFKKWNLALSTPLVRHGFLALTVQHHMENPMGSRKPYTTDEMFFHMVSGKNKKCIKSGACR